MIDNDVRMGFRSGERSRRSRRSRWLVPLISSIALVGCTGDDDATNTTSEGPATTETSDAPTATETTAVTTESPTTTTITTATAPPTSATTTAATSTPTTGVPPPTTSAPPEPTTTLSDPQAEEAVAAYVASFDSWTECLRALPNCDLQSLTPTRHDNYLNLAVTQADRYNEAGQTAENLDSRGVVVESAEVMSPTQVNVVACEVDGVVRRDSAGSVVDDSFQSARTLYVLVEVDGAWKVSGAERIEVGETEESNVCG